ncbi:MAG: hypothetical protein ACJ8AI_13515 [Rhodopila sp.]
MLRIAGIILLMVVAGCANTREPPGGNFKKVSQLVRFPDFYPGLGTLYVQPDTLPEGPFYGYDRQGRLVNTFYMLPMRLLNSHTMLDALQGTRLRADHVDVHYTDGHPGVAEPHYHIILWDVSSEEAAKVQ